MTEESKDKPILCAKCKKKIFIQGKKSKKSVCLNCALQDSQWENW